jgi:zinc/manganese transport system substrate-binding protein
MSSLRRLRPLAAAASLALIATACGDAGTATTDDATEAAAPAADPISVVATTSILGDIVEQLVQDDGEVTVLMGPGVDPHAYSPSARDGATMQEADLVVANGLQLEESLISTLEATEDAGVRVFELAPLLDPIEFDDDAHDDHGHGDEGDDHGHGDEGDDHGHGDEGDDHGHEDEGDDHDHGDEGDDHGHGDEGDDHGHEDEGDDHGHGDEGDDHGHGDEGDDHGHGDEGDDHGHEDEGDDHDHAHGPEDPHVWFDAERMTTGIELLAAELAEVAPQVDADEWQARAEAYNEQLLEIDAELTEAFAEVPDERRVVVTNHDALGYLAARYDLDVVATVIPGASTQVEANPRQFAELIETVEERDVRVVFADNTDSTRLAEQLASESVGRTDVELEVVQVATDALGEPGSPADSYLGLLRETGLTIAETLAAS